MRDLTPTERQRVLTALFSEPADIITPRGGPYRCSADNAVVHVNPTTMQSAYCDGERMHRWLYCQNRVYLDDGTSAPSGGSWRQVS